MRIVTRIIKIPRNSVNYCIGCTELLFSFQSNFRENFQLKMSEISSTKNFRNDTVKIFLWGGGIEIQVVLGCEI